MQKISAIFVNKRDVLDESSNQHYIYKDMMNQTERNDLKEFSYNSFLIIPYVSDSDNGDVEYKFFIIMRDTNVNCEAFFNGVYGLFNIINDAEPDILEFIKNHGLTIVLDQLTSVEDYVTPEMVESLFSLIFNDGRQLSI